MMDYDQSSSELLKLLLNGRAYKVPKGQVLQLSGDHMLLNVVKTGFVKRYLITNDGSQSIQSIYGPNDVFPLTPIFKVLFNTNIYRGEEIIYYEAITPATILSIDQATFMAAIEQDPLLYRDLLYVAGVRLDSNIQRLENMSLRVANRKVVHQLVYFADKFAEKTDKGILLTVPLTHQTLADVLNLARETVTHCLSRLQEKGLIEVGKHILILDLEKLKQTFH